MVTIEINTDILIILWIFFTICLFIGYVFERQDARLYKHLYYDLLEWTRVIPENELKEKLSQHEKEEEWKENLIEF